MAGEQIHPPSLLEDINQYQVQLTDDERLDFWDMIQAGYCCDCGGILYETKWGSKCYCWNDE
jgi:hypothetical protein